jgi:O-antigen ligase
MLNYLLMQKKIKPIILLFAIGFLAYQIGKVAPGMLTLHLGTLMHMGFSVMPGIALVILIAFWNPSGQTMRLKCPKLPPIKDILTKRNLMFLLPMYVLFALVALWLITHFQSFMIVGHIMLLGSILSLFILGLIKPGLGPVAFFAVYPFLWFAEGRLNSSIYWLFADAPNLPEWFQRILVGLRNIDVVLLIFTIGFIFFAISHSRLIKKTILDIPIILLLSWTLLSVITANDRFAALEVYFRRWIFSVAIYYATFFSLERKNSSREIKISLVALLFFACLLNIQNTLLTGGSPWVSESVTFGEGRAMIWTIIAYQMGPWTILIFPLAFSLLFDREEPTYIRLFSFISIILGLVMALWEMQRVVILGLFLMAVLSFIFYRHRWRKQLVLYAILGIILLFSFNKLIEIVGIMRPSLLQGNFYSSTENLDRLYLWEMSWGIIKDNPVLGIGPGGFRNLFIGFNMPETNSHNIIIEIALESGIIASFLLLTVIFLPVFKTIESFSNGNYKARDTDLRPWIISLFGIMLVLMFGDVWNRGLGVAVFCILGLLAGSIKKS